MLHYPTGLDYHSCSQGTFIEAYYVPGAVLESFVELITDGGTREKF